MYHQQVDSKNKGFGKCSGLENDIKNMYIVSNEAVASSMCQNKAHSFLSDQALAQGGEVD